MQGLLIRKSLKTDVLTVAKLRLGDEEKKLRQTAGRKEALQKGRGQMTFGDALAIYQERLKANRDIKSKTKDYYQQRVDALLRSWPDLKEVNVREISKQDCEGWVTKLEGSEIALNNTVLVFRSVLDICVEQGIIYENLARHVKRRTVKPKEMHLPDNAQFSGLVEEVAQAGGRFSPDCADLLRFLTYGGFRLGEAKNITWADCDMKREEIIVRDDPEEGTKNSAVRRVPVITEMRQLLERLRAERPNDPEDARVMKIAQCPAALNRATHSCPA